MKIKRAVYIKNTFYGEAEHDTMWTYDKISKIKTQKS